MLPQLKDYLRLREENYEDRKPVGSVCNRRDIAYTKLVADAAYIFIVDFTGPNIMKEIYQLSNSIDNFVGNLKKKPLSNLQRLPQSGRNLGGSADQANIR